MPEPFKNVFNESVIRAAAAHLGRASPGFDAERFVAQAATGLEALELKARAAQIAGALARTLPQPFPAAVRALVGSLAPPGGDDGWIADGETAEAGVRGWMVMPMADFIAGNGQRDPALSLAALREMTMRFTAEFAVRPFLIGHEGETLQTFGEWAEDANPHVRRLVSEGSRPRLPWAMRLPRFIADPAPILPLLDRLKDDPEEYVRRSVANNLNDIAKDHPDLVAGIAADWLRGASPERARLVRHGLRTLVKAGHPGALAALGYGPPAIEVKRFMIDTPEVELGGALAFTVELTSLSDATQQLVIDYAVHHRRANGGVSRKVFKWRGGALSPGQTLAGARRHPIRPITTRRYYPGEHRVELLINGEAMAEGAFTLRIDRD